MIFNEPSLLFLLQIIALYFISKVTIQEIFLFFAIFTSNRKIVFILTSILFFPGTIIHEMAHFITAMILMLKVRDVDILPKLEKNQIKLGRVLYEKKDVVRGIIVGVAPIFAGLLFFWFISHLEKIASTNIVITAFLIYAIFTVSTTMFSSKQDLIDIIFIIPFVIIFIIVLYFLQVPILSIVQDFLPKLDKSLITINRFLFYSFIIHAILIISFKSLRKILKK